MLKKQKLMERKQRAKKILALIKKNYPEPISELKYKSSFQFLVAVILSAQYTDKRVNELTRILFKKYKSVSDFADVSLKEFSDDIKTVSYFNNKAKNIISTANMIRNEFSGRLPKTLYDLQKLPGVGYKTANVVLGEIHGVWEGIAVDTHVRRFAIRFDLTDSKNPDRIAKDLENLVPKKEWKYINNGLVLYGRYVCKAIPHDCSKHMLSDIYPESANIWPKSK